MNDFPWTLFFVLLAGGLVGGTLLLPYVFSLNKASIPEEAKAKVKLTKPAIVAINLVQTGILIAITAFLGLLAARQVGLRLPIFEALIAGQPIGEAALQIFGAALLASIIVGAVFFVLERFVFLSKLPKEFLKLDGDLSFWKRLLACFYGGFNEEILMRLFLVSGLTWLVGLVWKAPGGAPADGAFWLAIFLSSLLFGVGHLVNTRALVKITPAIVARGLLLNGIPGVAFGYLFWRYGLEAAMLAHFILDLWVHLGLTPIIKASYDESNLQTAGSFPR